MKQLAPFFMRKRFLIPLLTAISLPTNVLAGIPSEKDAWVAMDGNWSIYQINTLDAKASGSKITLGISRGSSTTDRPDGYHVNQWTGKVKIDCKKFTYTISARVGGRGLFPSSTSGKINPNNAGYPLADNLCFLTGVEGYTRNSYTPDWALRVIKTIESQPIKKYVNQGSVTINCDSPVWKNKPRCN